MAPLTGSSTEEIEAPLDQVWDLVEDVETAPDWQRGLTGLALALALGLGLAAPAAARIIQATSILPPGESGFVSLAGVATGTGSPHLYDQQSPFINFDRKDATFNQPGTEEDPAAGV